MITHGSKCGIWSLQILEPKDTHMAASCMEFNEGGSWRGRERESERRQSQYKYAGHCAQAVVRFYCPSLYAQHFARLLTREYIQRIHMYICIYVYKKLMLMIMC